MTSPIASSPDPDFVYAAHQASHLSSEEDLFRGLNSYRVSGTRNHEFKTYLLEGKLVALPSVPLSNYSSIIDIKQD
jgi:hypothetical protein